MRFDNDTLPLDPSTLECTLRLNGIYFFCHDQLFVNDAIKTYILVSSYLTNYLSFYILPDLCLLQREFFCWNRSQICLPQPEHELLFDCYTANCFFLFFFFFYMKNYTPKVFSPCCLRAQLLSSLASMLPFFHPSSCYSIHILLNYFSILFQGQALNAFTLSSALFEFLNQPKLFQDAHVTQPAPLVTAFKLPYQHLFYLSLSLSSFPFFLSCPWPLPSFLGMCTLVMHKLSFN